VIKLAFPELFGAEMPEREPDIAYRERLLLVLHQEIEAVQIASGKELDEIGDAWGLPRDPAGEDTGDGAAAGPSERGD